MDQQLLVGEEHAEPTVGALLRAHRVARGEGLQTVADALCIRITYLQAIEEGRPERLPGLVYAVGYAKSFAKHLGLDSTRIGERVRRDYLTSRSLVPDPGLGPLPDRTDRATGKGRIFRRWFG